LNKKLSDKDKKDWQSFVENKEKLENKDLEIKKENIFFEKTIDLHGYTLNDANKKIKDFIEDSYNIGVSKINIITGKGSRSKVNDDPYKSANFGILKYSIPEFIKNDADLIKIIKEIDFDSINSENQGSFNITLKKK
tara:strand:- start:74 stop:484 length:411 start_codon:yes stop_codon:yes gene_type:complete